ncbi:P-loop containing nucleoside triphosphate hydrolase protein [Radiomyces spectabilis]|uniref:P-loop containing nucleoside triphosphate hydrolase protein n=1 Tax=Radiomyces spectabilis TaxID=64574 RepID=UPI00221FD74B|nr:P-loop containing nucleoside triphosphate hydrolase protein [Radiomyces spectabilis]KAI8391175.1 P-loop containing nucleoside triphosphate hydrolase protein [Radiomyces spectabilis]
MSSLDYIAELSAQDYTKLGIRSIEDKRKFMALAQDLKQRRQLKTQPQRPVPQPTTASPTKTNERMLQPRKRSTNSYDAGKDKKARRMTMGPQSIPRHLPSKSPVNNRRLSCLPKRDAAPLIRRSPVRAGVGAVIKTASPLRQNKPSAKLLKFMEEVSNTADTTKDVIPVQRNRTRLLDAYGIPITPSKRRSSLDQLQPVSHMSFEEYVKQRQSGNTTATTTTTATTSKVTTTYASGASDLQQRIRVCVRKRPLNKKELALNEKDIAPLVGARTIQVNASKTRVDLSRFTEQHSFTFDEAFDSYSTNSEIYQRTARPLVDYIFAGGKATCFAYGQTGSGKTYTMLDPQHGLYVQAAADIFSMLNEERYSHLAAWVGFYEIYQGQLFDLLNQRSRLIPREDGNSNVIIAGLSEYPINDVDKLMEIFDFGSQARTTGKTGANSNSSRSHAVLQVLLKPKDESTVHGKLSFIDLAGSERGADRGDANNKTRMEGAEINKSLLALKECIRALDQDKKHTPFRGSKLTQVLRDSFVGNSRTCMIATISPNNMNSEHTLNTLRYADRVKELKGETDPRLLPDPKHSVTERAVENGIQMERNEGSNVQSTPEPGDMKDDAKSLTNSDAIWENETAENLLDVDFPIEANEALSTPQNERYWNVTTPQRQENYMRRLSTPPDEIFQTPMDGSDPFAESPVRPEHAKEEVFSTPERSNGLSLTGTPADGEKITVDHIKKFIRLHRAQIKELEECIRQEKKLIAKLSMNLSSHHDFSEEGELDDGKSMEDFEDYLNDLDDMLERKIACVETLKERVKVELGDDEDMNDSL